MDELKQAWLLHRRPYKERSVIAEFLVEDHGRIAMVVQGVRQARSVHAATLQPFNRLLVSWRGRGGLKTLLHLESSNRIALTGTALFSGFYVNELLLRVLLQGQYLEGVFHLYQSIIESLASGSAIEPVLRLFELELLELSGYCPSLDIDASSGTPITAGIDRYWFQPETGLFPVAGTLSKNQEQLCFTADLLLALSLRDFSNPGFYPGFKRFTRLALKPLLGDRPLQSRELFKRSTVIKE